MSNGYAVIVVDPPWEIAKIKQQLSPSSKKMDYSMMTLDEIKALPIGTIAAETCTLFLWTIDKYLFDSRDVLESWGFAYHCTMSWDKTNGIAIYGFNRQTEFILVGLRGKHDVYPHRKTIRTSFTAKSQRHSEKPHSFYQMLDVLEGPKIDLFARQARPGWHTWGNEADGDLNDWVDDAFSAHFTPSLPQTRTLKMAGF